jgi:hypothetical protein
MPPRITVFKKLLSNVFSRANAKLPPVGNTDAVCPYCESCLKKFPGRKTKCPHCKKYMYVRTRPCDEKKVVVTEDGVEIINEQWSIVNGTHDQFLAEKRRFESEREALTRRFGRDASDDDVAWSLMNKELLLHAKNRDWGMFVNTKLDMAEALRKQGRMDAALAAYGEVCYLDLNGPGNNGAKWDPVNDSMIAPAVLKRFVTIANSTGVDLPKLEEVFITRANAVRKNIKTPLTAKVAWQRLCNELD